MTESVTFLTANVTALAEGAEIIVTSVATIAENM